MFLSTSTLLKIYDHAAYKATVESMVNATRRTFVKHDNLTALSYVGNILVIGRQKERRKKGRRVISRWKALKKTSRKIKVEEWIP